MPALSIRGLRKTYRNGFEALSGIDLEVAAGDFFALLGPNGAGKSTAIGIVCSLVRKSGGTVSVFGHDLDRNPQAVKHCIGLVPQEFNFNQFEPVEEIVINQAGYQGIRRREARRRAQESLEQLDLWSKRRSMARELSGGMKRRLMIARALIHRPRLLILDEPTAGVDIEIRRTMWDFMREINALGTTIILTTHYLEEAESLCRDIAIIDHGRIVEQSTMRALFARLHRETFVLNLAAPLLGVPQMEGMSFTKVDDETLEVCLTRKRSLNELFDMLSRQGIRVTSLRNKQNRLEQLFLDMTGGNVPRTGR
jgi:ABC-2 type transport system ATP-binding protein